MQPDVRRDAPQEEQKLPLAAAAQTGHCMGGEYVADADMTRKRAPGSRRMFGVEEAHR